MRGNLSNTQTTEEEKNPLNKRKTLSQKHYSMGKSIKNVQPDGRKGGSNPSKEVENRVNKAKGGKRELIPNSSKTMAEDPVQEERYNFDRLLNIVNENLHKDILWDNMKVDGKIREILGKDMNTNSNTNTNTNITEPDNIQNTIQIDRSDQDEIKMPSQAKSFTHTNINTKTGVTHIERENSKNKKLPKSNINPRQPKFNERRDDFVINRIKEIEEETVTLDFEEKKLGDEEEKLLEKAQELENQMNAIKLNKIELVTKQFEQQLVKDAEIEKLRQKEIINCEYEEKNESLTQQKDSYLKRISELKDKLESHIDFFNIIVNDLDGKMLDLSNCYSASLEYLNKEKMEAEIEYGKNLEKHISDRINIFKNYVTAKYK